MQRILLLLVGLVMGLFTAGCERQETSYLPQFSAASVGPGSKKPLIFGVHPLHNPDLLFERYQPLVDYLNRHLRDVDIQLEASRDYPSYDEKLFSGHFDLALPNPYETIEAADHGYRIFAKMGNDEDFRGIFLVRKDSGIKTVADLKGKAVSYPAPSALAATMLPQWFLKQKGLDVFKDIDNRYVGSQESSILNVYQGLVAAGATWPPPWRAMVKKRPELATVLEVKWQTETLPNNGLVARKDVPLALVARIRDLLVHLHENPEGRAILANMENDSFAPADGATYEPVRVFVRRFRAELRDPRAER